MGALNCEYYTTLHMPYFLSIPTYDSWIINWIQCFPVQHTTVRWKMFQIMFSTNLMYFSFIPRIYQVLRSSFCKLRKNNKNKTNFIFSSLQFYGKTIYSEHRPFVFLLNWEFLSFHLKYPVHWILSAYQNGQYCYSCNLGLLLIEMGVNWTQELQYWMVNMANPITHIYSVSRLMC